MNDQPVCVWGKLLLTLGLAFVLLCAGFIDRGIPSASAASGEYATKAAFLYNFARFIEWPESAFASQDAPLVVGVIGENPFGDTLDKLRTQTIKNRKIEVKHFTQLAELTACHVLFISDSEEMRQTQILDALQGTSTLTIGDHLRQFGARGGMINFMLFQDTIRFTINVGAARRAGLEMSSQLLKLAAVVMSE